MSYIVEYGEGASMLQSKLDYWASQGYRLHTVNFDFTTWMVVMELELNG